MQGSGDLIATSQRTLRSLHATHAERALFLLRRSGVWTMRLEYGGSIPYCRVKADGGARESELHGSGATAAIAGKSIRNEVPNVRCGVFLVLQHK